MKRTSLIIAAVIIAAAAVIYFSASRASSIANQKLIDDFMVSSHISKLYLSDLEKVASGEVHRYDAISSIHSLAEKARAIEDEVISIDAPFINRDSFVKRRQTAIEHLRAVSDLLIAAETVTQFSLFEYSQEAEENKQLAIDTQKRISKLEDDFWNSSELPAPQESMKSEFPQFIFVVLFDATRADALGCYGNERPTTPNIDSLAGGGIQFENAFSAAALTDSSVASIMTSLYPRTHKMTGGSDWLYEASLISKFKEAGYRTIGLSANPLISHENHYDTGFDHFEELPYARASVVFNHAKNLIDRYGMGEKVFFYVHLMDPHDAYLAPGPFMDMYDPKYNFSYTGHWIRNAFVYDFVKARDIDPACDYNPITENWNNPELLFHCYSLLSDKPEMTQRDIDNLLARYHGEITYADHEFGRFLSYIDNKGIKEKSTIAVLADHGELFLDHNRFMHGVNVYEKLIHVPLVLWSGDGSIKPASEQRTVETIDLLPTLLEIAGAEVPGGLHGRNLFSDDSNEAVYSFTWDAYDPFSRTTDHVYSARTPSFKYIATFNHLTDELIRDEFYDLELNKAEMNDVRQDFPEEFEALKKKFEHWYETTDTVPPRDIKKGMSDTRKEKLRQLGYIQ